METVFLFWLAVCGFVGYLVRALIAVYKNCVLGSEPFNKDKFIGSLLTGCVVGAVAGVIMGLSQNAAELTNSLIISCLTAGYMGIDIIDTLLKK